MWLVNKILIYQKLLLLTIFINHSDLQPPLDSFIISNVRTYRRHWPLEPDGTVTINKTRYTIEPRIFERIRQFFDCYIILYRSYFILVESKRFIFTLEADKKTIQSKQPKLTEARLANTRCSRIDLTMDNLSFDIFVSTDNKGIDHLFGLNSVARKYSLDKELLKTCNKYVLKKWFSIDPKSIHSSHKGLKCFQVFNSQRNDYSNRHFYCLFSDNINYLWRACSEGKTPGIHVTKRFVVNKSSPKLIAASVVKHGGDTILYIFYETNHTFAYRVNKELDEELDKELRHCHGLSANEKFDDCLPSFKEKECPLRNNDVTNHIETFPKSFGKIIDTITFEQEVPYKFNIMLIIELNRITVIRISTNNTAKGGIQRDIIERKITLPSTDIKFSYEGEHFRYFTRSSKTIHSLPEIGLPCLILDSIYCFLFEKEFGCQYNQNTQFCIKNVKQSGIKVIKTNRISFTIRPSYATTKEKRKVTIYGATEIFHGWILKKYQLNLKLTLEPSGIIEFDKNRESLKEFQFSFKQFNENKKLKPNTSITIKLGFVLRRLNKTVTTAKHQTIFLTDPSIIEIVPDYVFPRLKNARFLVKLLSIPSDLNKFSFRLNNSKDFVKMAHKIVNSSENIIHQTIKLEHEFISPTKVPIQLIFGGKVYGKRDLTVMKRPTLPENLNIVIFSEAEFSLTWNGTGFEAFKDPAIGVTNNTSPKSVYSTCYVQNYVTCAYPKLPQIKIKYRTTLFFYSHFGRIELLSNQVTYLPAPSNFYAYTAENYVRLSADNLHHTYPAEVSLMKIGGQQKLECSSLKNKTINVAQGLVDIICFLNESLYNPTDWMLNLKIGNWSVSSISVKLTPRPAEHQSSSKFLFFVFLLVLIVFIVVIFKFTPFMSKSKPKDRISLKEFVLRIEAKQRANIKTKFQATDETGAGLKTAGLPDSSSKIKQVTEKPVPIETKPSTIKTETKTAATTTTTTSKTDNDFSPSKKLSELSQKKETTEAKSTSKKATDTPSLLTKSKQEPQKNEQIQKQSKEAKNDDATANTKREENADDSNIPTASKKVSRKKGTKERKLKSKKAADAPSLLTKSKQDSQKKEPIKKESKEVKNDANIAKNAKTKENTDVSNVPAASKKVSRKKETKKQKKGS